ncbi:MAG: MBL fold metallo-hydrolase [Actinobacteria bacterium]|nr:MBL fold metallo-hydrolase [Actinomycetota bacterium]
MIEITESHARGVEPDDRQTVTTPGGQRAHRLHVAQSERVARKFFAVGDDAWCLVGNGLANQTFVRGPEGIIAIDTGESIEEMRAAIAALREVTGEPIVAVVYTHFHYVAGTQAVLDEAGADTPIWGHAMIDANRSRAQGEIGPTYIRGVIEQFGIALPSEGDDAVVNVGLGQAWHNAEHAPFTSGYVAPTHTFDADTTISVAGLELQITLAPSDADDSVTIWFPELELAVHNIVWPVLFNVFAIRGEEYRDPCILLSGMDHLHGLSAEHLIGTHGPPMSGRDEIAARVTRSRDAIQFLWDQTVRWTNRGATGPELAHLVVLPECYDDDYLTQQLYGLVEHHTRQIRSGLFGFFDGDPQQLLPLPPALRSERFIDAMGGRDAVRDRVRAALDDDVRWSLELAGILAAAADAQSEDRELLAAALRVAARRTTAANIRNWCLTRARDVEGTGDLSLMRAHRFNREQVLDWPATTAVHMLRVLVDPRLLSGVNLHLCVELDEDRAGLHFRNAIACPTDGAGAEATLHTKHATWAELLDGTLALGDAIGDARVTIDGDVAAVRAALRCIDLPAFR